MTATAGFPPLGLRIEAGPLVLRSITDEVIAELIEVALAGVHPLDEMPFATPWTDVPADELPANFARYHWGVRAGFTPAKWTLDLAVEYDGRLVGAQGLMTSDYLVTRTAETGSWLGLAHHGQGIGTRMRQAMCAFCFDHLDAVELTSAAFVDNPASLAVSRKVGYQPNGRRRTVRGDTAVELTELVLTPATFVRGEPIKVTGVAAFRKFIGLD